MGSIDMNGWLLCNFITVGQAYMASINDDFSQHVQRFSVLVLGTVSGQFVNNITGVSKWLISENTVLLMLVRTSFFHK